MMAHSVIPHHHQEEETATEHHDKDHHDDEGDNALTNLFSHFQHLCIVSQSTAAHQPSLVKQTDIPQPDISFSNLYNFYFSASGELVPILFPHHPVIFSSSVANTFALRGPPAFTF